MSGYYRAPISPGQSWFTTVGGGLVPAAGGFITTYLAAGGYPTPAATYADNAGTPNTNPIVLNSQGRLPGVDVWLDGGVAYRFIITDSVGNVLADVDNIVGIDDPAFAAGSFGEWLDGPAATWLSGTSFSCAGDQVSQGPLSRDRRIEITSGAGVTRGTISSSVFGSVTTVTFDKDTADPAPTNPISALRYGILNVPQPSFPSAVLALGQPRHRDATSTNVLLYGPIGSNVAVWNTSPDTVAAAGGAGNQQVTGTVNGVAGSLTFNKTAHGRTTGEAVQLTTNAPPNTALLTTYIVFVVDANNYGLYPVPAGWQFEQPYLDPVTTPGGLTWGNPIAFGGAAAGNTTITPGFVPPTGVTRVWDLVKGGGNGGGGSRGSTGDGGVGSNGGGSSFGTHSAAPGVVSGGGGGSATQGGSPASNTGGGTGALITAGGVGGQPGQLTTTGGSRGGPGGPGILGGNTTTGTKTNGAGGDGGASGAGTQGSGAGGASGSYAAGPQTVVPGTWIAATVGAGGGGGTAGTGTNSNAGQAGAPGIVIVCW